MGKFGEGKPQGVVVKTYGRGSFLGLLSIPFAFVMASLGMNGWHKTAAQDMEDDAVAMSKLGYRVVSSQEFGWPFLGITYYKVTYERR
jgi:hypothetical protein